MFQLSDWTYSRLWSDEGSNSGERSFSHLNASLCICARRGIKKKCWWRLVKLKKIKGNVTIAWGRDIPKRNVGENMDVLPWTWRRKWKFYVSCLFLGNNWKFFSIWWYFCEGIFHGRVSGSQASDYSDLLLLYFFSFLAFKYSCKRL